MARDDDRLYAIDLFAGAGGLSLGLGQAGFTTLYANELVPTYARTFAANHPNTWVDATDIRQVDELSIRQQLGLAVGDLDLLAGGPPCQGFSINAPKRSLEDQRNHLFLDYLRFVEAFYPRAVLIENVPGLVSFSHGGTLRAILNSLEALGYVVDVQILYAPHFGVPQTRWRTFILGIRRDITYPMAFPAAQFHAPTRVNFTSTFEGRSLLALPSLETDLPPHTTVREAIDDLPPLSNGEESETSRTYPVAAQNPYQASMRAGSHGVTSHDAPKLSSTNLERLKHIPAGGNWTDIPVDLLPKGMKRARRTDHTKRYGRVSPDGLASTILTKCDPHWGAYFHYNQDRSFTVREAARLQSFPDRYSFTGSRVDQYAQVGNAVPPLLAQAVGQAIAETLNASTGITRKAA